MASFNALDLGPVVKVFPEPAEKESQINSFPGVDGLEHLDGGTRGGMSSAIGLFVADNATDLAAVIATFNALQQDGGAYTLIDTKGTSWPKVILKRVKLTGPVEEDDQGLAQEYEMEFLHLI